MCDGQISAPLWRVLKLYTRCIFLSLSWQLLPSFLCWTLQLVQYIFIGVVSSPYSCGPSTPGLHGTTRPCCLCEYIYILPLREFHDEQTARWMTLVNIYLSVQSHKRPTIRSGRNKIHPLNRSFLFYIFLFFFFLFLSIFIRKNSSASLNHKSHDNVFPIKALLFSSNIFI